MVSLIGESSAKIEKYGTSFVRIQAVLTQLTVVPAVGGPRRSINYSVIFCLATTGVRPLERYDDQASSARWEYNQQMMLALV